MVRVSPSPSLSPGYSYPILTVTDTVTQPVAQTSHGDPPEYSPAADVLGQSRTKTRPGGLVVASLNFKFIIMIGISARSAARRIVMTKVWPPPTAWPGARVLSTVTSHGHCHRDSESQAAAGHGESREVTVTWPGPLPVAGRVPGRAEAE